MRRRFKSSTLINPHIRTSADRRQDMILAVAGAAPAIGCTARGRRLGADEPLQWYWTRISELPAVPGAGEDPVIRLVRLAYIPEKGIFIPDMGTRSTDRSGLATVLFSPVLRRVLGLLYGQPDRSFQSAELIRLAGSGTGAPHRVLTRLAAAGLVTVTRSGNQKHYRANRACPVFEELHRLIVKTVGVVEPLRQALQPKRSDIRAAFVYGSVAKGTDKAGSDIDLMVVSARLRHGDLFEMLQPVESVLARRVNPTVMSRKEWRAKRTDVDSFAARVAAGPRLFVIGNDDDLD
jgi:predicted nucleotidyltransferase